MDITSTTLSRKAMTVGQALYLKFHPLTLSKISSTNCILYDAFVAVPPVNRLTSVARVLLLKCCCRVIRDGSPWRPPRLSHSSWALLGCSASWSNYPKLLHSFTDGVISRAPKLNCNDLICLMVVLSYTVVLMGHFFPFIWLTVSFCFHEIPRQRLLKITMRCNKMLYSFLYNTCCVMMKCVSPLYNHSCWLGVKNGI